MRAAIAGAFACTLTACTSYAPPQEWSRDDGGGDVYDSTISYNYVMEQAALEAGATQPLEMLTWEEAIRVAREQSPTVAAAAAHILRAESRLREASAGVYPSVDVRAGYVHYIEAASFRGAINPGGSLAQQFVGAGSGIYSSGVDLSYRVFDGGSTYYGTEAASAALDASRSDHATALDELELRVSTAFLNALLAERAIEIAEEALQFTEEQVQRALVREEAGEALRVDRLRFATRASEQKLAHNRAQAALRVRLAVLKELLGTSLADNVQLVRPATELDVPDGDLVAVGLQHRPEAQALHARIRETQSRMSEVGARYWPSLDLFASYGFLSIDEPGFGSDDTEATVGGALSWNVYEGGATSARESSFRHQLLVLRNHQRELALVIEREVREAEVNLAVARDNVGVSQQGVALAEEVLEQISAQYLEGESQVLDVTEAELQYTRGQLALLQSKVQVLLSQARLRRAAGMDIAGTK